MLLTILAVSFIITLAMGFPVALVLAISSTAYLLADGQPLSVIPQKMFSGMDSFVLLSIPGFVLAGNLMNGGGITERIIAFANALVGHIRGGLAQTKIAASMVFAGISGTAAADAASLGAVMIPGMVRAGYPVGFAAALTAAASTVGPIIPPSVPMIIVGSMTGISVGQMFLAGAVPGVLLGLGMMITAYVIAVRNKFPREPWRGLRHLWVTGKGAIWAILMTFIILVGIVSGQFTPTEAAVIAVVYAFVIGLFVYKGITLRALPKIIADSAISGAAIMVLVGFANVFGYILTAEQIPQMVASWLLAFSRDPFVIIFLINILLLIVGMFMETIAALIILVPPLLSVAQSVGLDPVHFATFVVLNLMIGLTTPPVGVCLFICANIGKITLTQISRAVWPFLAANIFVLFLVSYIPALSLWLPRLFYR